MANYDDALKATFPQGPVSKESADALGMVVDNMRAWMTGGPPEPELVKGVRERLDALTGMGGGPWANVWSSIDYAGSLRDRLEVDLAHHTPATPAERLALLERIDALSVAMGRAWQVADMLGWENPNAAKAG